MQLKHDDRVRIEIYLQEGRSIMEISKILKHDYKTILREVNNRKHLLLNFKTITHISSIEEHICNLLNKNPKVCNKCPKFKRNKRGTGSK